MKRKTMREADMIKNMLFNYLNKNGDKTREELKEILNPDCSVSMIDSTLKKWRIENNIATRKTKQTKSIVQEPENKPVDPVPETKLVINDTLGEKTHRFTCSVDIPEKTYKRFKLIAGYKNDRIRVLLENWISNYVDSNKSVLELIFEDLIMDNEIDLEKSFIDAVKEINPRERFVRIDLIRNKLNWSKKQFDDLLVMLAHPEKNKISLEHGDQSKLTTKEVEDCFVDPVTGSQFISITLVK